MDDDLARSAASQPHHGSQSTVGSDAAEGRPGHSMWWMVACCVPMVLIAAALLLGVFGAR